MREKLLAGCLVLLSFLSFAQSPERHWEEGDLTWDDFLGEPFSSGNLASELSWQLSYATTKRKLSDTTILAFQTRAYIYPGSSWVNEDFKTDELLLYNQVLFNIIELNRRLLQTTLHRSIDVFLAEEKLRTQYSRINQETREFQKQTENGTNLEALNFWNEKINRRLAETPLEIVPEFTDRQFGFGMNVGMGGGFFTNELGNHFSPPLGLVYGFDLAYKKAVLYINATLAGDKLRLPFTDAGKTWGDDLKANVAVIDLSVGYPVYNAGKHKFTPFAGFGILEFSASAKEGEAYEDHRIVNYGLIAGINYDFRFRTSLQLTPSPFGHGRAKAEQFFRARLYVTPANFEIFKGTSVNLAVSYAFLAKFIEVR